MSLQNTPLQPLTPARLLHVIAKHALATALTPHVSACHCEPVRTLVWQSVSPQRNLTSLCYFGQIRNAFRIRPKYCVSLCATARSTDCHVASLLAMTCSNLPRVSTSNYVRPGQIRSFSVFAGGICTLFCPAAGDADCPVASLLAMTCSNLPRGPIIPGYCRCTAGKRPCTRNHAPAFCMSLQNTPLQPHSRRMFLHVIANQCAHWCGNP